MKSTRRCIPCCGHFASTERRRMEEGPLLRRALPPLLDRVHLLPPLPYLLHCLPPLLFLLLPMLPLLLPIRPLLLPLLLLPLLLLLLPTRLHLLTTPLTMMIPMPRLLHPLNRWSIVSSVVRRSFARDRDCYVPPVPMELRFTRDAAVAPPAASVKMTSRLPKRGQGQALEYC